jgi:hypothetical protein
VTPSGRRGVVALALVVLCSAGGAGADTQSRVTGWLSYGNGVQRHGNAATRLDPALLDSSWFAPVDGTVTTQPLAARNVPGPGQTTLYVASSTGLVWAYAPNGYVRWRIDLGHLVHSSCHQLPQYGVTGTPVIDPATRALYVADAFGRLHALDLTTGAERPGWPVPLYTDRYRELVWGALMLVRGSIYVPTGSYCDRPMEGKLLGVSIATRAVHSWTSVPYSLGGGGGIWGWGGAAYSAKRQSIFVVTGNAFNGGSNTGSSFHESAGYGEQLVQLTPDLRVRAASHPPDIRGNDDLDFVGSPVIVDRTGCGELVAALNKNGRLYLWRSIHIARGPIQTLALQNASPQQPVLTQPAYSPELASLYVVTFSRLVRVTITKNCHARIAWSRPLGSATLHGSPTVSGNVVWLTLSGSPAKLAGFDARTGALRLSRMLGGISFAAPLAVDGRLFVDARHGYTTPTAAASRPATAASTLPEYRSWADTEHGWESREDGVYATENAGSTWERLRAWYATRVLRTSATAGVISVGEPAPACDCATQQLWTIDGGRTWRVAKDIGSHFAGSGDELFWWNDNALYQVSPWPAQGTELTSRLIAKAPGQIIDVAVVPDGAVVLVAPSGAAPRLLFAEQGMTRTVTVPNMRQSVIAESLEVAGPVVTVTGTDFIAGTQVTWWSNDAGLSWQFSTS